MASTSTPASRSRSTSTSTSKFSTTVTASTPSTLQLSANFAGAHTKSHAGNSNAVGYDHETYLQLTAGEKAKEKTPNQVYREERARRRTTRALDPAILEPQGDPSPIDFECAEVQSKRDW
ncbi:hypothetical protein KXW98_003979 [Aspergillus fumigatus]|uniref:Uncharacterized protein n=3 Tax=Aspergillus fumigatus TaxID=746128 RepID=Q4WQI5_ASPFU|nr:hypothetical protein AFUA_4G12940 [Aspergillus fumigatus Af293]EDP50647.1 hypothetical protein AFUB_069840 [Aspergillus fumigatus A1163]KAF4255109.1 hypothetical protein CNMCM8057_004827 [Aspergillus fumigatus]KMK62471.1 hypothetical protein Y699_04854 [Aspergillus fumigatus Z5]EAL89499.1 hypothetical protein AFUA_4G12940 [Aspergillus fumigatus Af293]KAF4255423.1 hypothetical protein CNMCM8714_004378 [Aspergillus fumigatus]